jgi:hypothetical protein
MSAGLNAALGCLEPTKRTNFKGLTFQLLKSENTRTIRTLHSTSMSYKKYDGGGRPENGASVGAPPGLR